jgi:hypothetical protein
MLNPGKSRTYAGEMDGTNLFSCQLLKRSRRSATHAELDLLFDKHVVEVIVPLLALKVLPPETQPGFSSASACNSTSVGLRSDSSIPNAYLLKRLQHIFFLHQPNQVLRITLP